MRKKSANSAHGVHSQRLWKRAACFLLALAATCSASLAQSVSLEWDPNPEPDLAGYRVYRSITSGSGYVGLNASLVTTPSYTDQTVAPGSTFYYVVTAVNASGLESGFSNEVAAFVEIPNGDPIANAGPDQEVRERRPATLNGGGSSDPNGDPLSYLWTQLSGPPVTLDNPTLATVQFTAPSVDVGTQLSFQLLVDDGQGAQSLDETIVNVWANRPPAAAAGQDRTVDWGQAVTLTAAASDADGDPLSFQWVQTSGTPVTLSQPGSLATSFTAPTSDASLVFQFTAADDEFSATDTVVVTVANLNQDPTASAGPDLEIRERRHGVLLGSGQDPEQRPLTYQWTQISGPAVVLETPGQAQSGFEAPNVDVNSTLVFQLLVVDDRGAQDSDETVVTVLANRAPSAEAGTAQTVDYGQSVTLSGGASDPDGDPLTFQWTQTAGTPVSLVGAGSLAAGFTAPATDDSLVFQFTSSDDEFSSSDTVTVTVANLNQNPTANAGPDQELRERRHGVLSGNGEDPERALLTYQWVQIGGPAVVLETPNQSQTGFDAPNVNVNSTLVFRLTVEDARGGQGSDETQVTVLANRSPSAEAGPDRRVDFSQVVELKGGATDPEGDTLTYQWTQTYGDPVTLTGANSPTVSFTAPAADGVLVFILSVADDEFTASDTVRITVEDFNRDPVADAGPDQTVRERKPASLSGSGTDPEGDPLTFQWSQISGPPVTLDTPDQPQTSFRTPKIDGNSNLVFRLLVADGNGGQDTDDVVVTVTDNRPPHVAATSADSSIAKFEEVVNLEGSATDPDGDALRYAWIQTAGTPVQLSGANTSSATFVAPSQEGTLSFNFTAQDDELTGSAPLQVQIIPSNREPSVAAGPDRKVRERKPATITAVASDPDGDPLTYAWTQVAGPPVQISGSTQARMTFTAPETDSELHLQFRVEVSDGRGLSAGDQVLVAVTNNRPPVVNAGSDATTTAGRKVWLIGSAEDPDDDELEYSWVQISGPRVTIGQSYLKSAYFVAPFSEGTAVFRFSARDDEFAVPDTVELKFVARPPLAFPAKIPSTSPEFADMFVGMALANPNDRLTRVTLSGLDANGLELDRVQLASLSPNGQNAFLTGEFPNLVKQSTSLLAQGSDAALRGFFMIGDWSLKSVDGVGGELAESSQLYFPIARRSGGDNTLIYLFNPASEDNRVSFRLSSPDGRSLRENLLTLPAQGSLSAALDEFLGAGTETEEGYLEVVGTSPLRGFELFKRPSSLVSAAGQRMENVKTLRAPHFFIDGAGGGTEIRLLSGATTEAAEFVVRALDDDSNPIAEYRGEIAPREMFVSDLGDLLGLSGGPAVSGHLEVELRSIPFGYPARVSGLITFEVNGGKAAASLPLASAGRTETKFFQVAQSAAANTFTGLTVLNPGDKPANVVLEAYDEKGLRTGRAEFTVEAGRRIVGLLDEPIFFGPKFQQVKGHLRLISSVPVNSFALFGDYGLNYLAALEGQ